MVLQKYSCMTTRKVCNRKVCNRSFTFLLIYMLLKICNRSFTFLLIYMLLKIISIRAKFWLVLVTTTSTKWMKSLAARRSWWHLMQRVCCGRWTVTHRHPATSLLDLTTPWGSGTCTTGWAVWGAGDGKASVKNLLIFNHHGIFDVCRHKTCCHMVVSRMRIVTVFVSFISKLGGMNDNCLSLSICTLIICWLLSMSLFTDCWWSHICRY